MDDNPPPPHVPATASVRHLDVPGTSSPGSRGASPEVEVARLLRGIWSGRWLIAAVTGVTLVLGITYALTATRIYRADVVMSPAEQRRESVNLGQLGSLAALAGIGLPGGSSSSEPLAVLRSKAFIAGFIEQESLLPAVVATMSRRSGVARLLGAGDTAGLDVQDATAYFLREALLVGEDKKTGVVTLTVEWPDPAQAAQWANSLAARLNGKMREMSLKESERNIEFLQAELRKTSIVPLQQAIGRILESEMQKLMLARGSPEFAFRVIDSALVAKKPSRPSRTLVVALSAGVGIFLSICIVAIRGMLSVADR